MVIEGYGISLCLPKTVCPHMVSCQRTAADKQLLPHSIYPGGNKNLSDKMTINSHLCLMCHGQETKWLPPGELFPELIP